MYLLPNKNQVDIEGAVLAVLDDEERNIYFLDIEKGNIVAVAVSGSSKTNILEKIRKQSGRYFKLPKASKSDKEEWLRDFVKEIIPFENIVFSKKLLAFSKEHFYNNALAEIENSKDGWIHGWAQWSNDHAYEILDEWFETLPVKIEDVWEECDDCAICRAMKSGKNSVAELSKAFSEQNFMNKVEEIFKPKNK